MKSPAERQQWILEYLRQRQALLSVGLYRVDVLNSDFVWAYVEANEVKCSVPPYGAPKCPTLGADLSALWTAGDLRRSSVGIGDGLCHQGFPRWVYSYHL